MKKTTTETIEWHKLPNDPPSKEEHCILMRVEALSGIIQGCYSGTHKTFSSPMGFTYNPTHWAYMPKGPQ